MKFAFDDSDNRIYAIDTNESKTKPNKIPEVAGRYDVVCYDIYDFIADRNLKMIRGNK